MEKVTYYFNGKNFVVEVDGVVYATEKTLPLALKEARARFDAEQGKK